MTAATVRAKFTVTAMTTKTYGSGVEIELQAVYDEQLPEDLRFSQATPSGSLTMYVDNKTAVERLIPDGQLGKSFYLDFIPCDTGDNFER